MRLEGLNIEMAIHKYDNQLSKEPKEWHTSSKDVPNCVEDEASGLCSWCLAPWLAATSV